MNNEEEAKQNFNLIKDKRDSLQDIIKFFDILIKTYKKESKNYFNKLNY